IAGARDVEELLLALQSAGEDQAARPSFALLVHLAEALWTQLQPEQRAQFLALWQRCEPDAAGIVQLLKFMHATDQTQFPAHMQAQALRTLGEQLRRNEPQAIVFPGNHDSFLRVSPVKPIAGKSYTVAL